MKQEDGSQCLLTLPPTNPTQWSRELLTMGLLRTDRLNQNTKKPPRNPTKVLDDREDL